MSITKINHKECCNKTVPIIHMEMNSRVATMVGILSTDSVSTKGSYVWS